MDGWCAEQKAISRPVHVGYSLARTRAACCTPGHSTQLTGQFPPDPGPATHVHITTNNAKQRSYDSRAYAGSSHPQSLFRSVAATGRLGFTMVIGYPTAFREGLPPKPSLIRRIPAGNRVNRLKGQVRKPLTAVPIATHSHGQVSGMSGAP